MNAQTDADVDVHLSTYTNYVMVLLHRFNIQNTKGEIKYKVGFIENLCDTGMERLIATYEQHHVLKRKQYMPRNDECIG